jgi:Cd2+/Zn2+-exporting ATPase
MLTGDNEFTAKAIAEELKLDSYKSNCFPDSKRTIIEELNKDNKHVMMVGDGINDAPALSLASVGVAMGDGTDVSLETADVVFMNNKLSHILSSITLSKRMKNVILQNMIFSISVIVLLLISNLFGWVLLPIGVIFHEGSTILVILNSLRLLFK